MVCRMGWPHTGGAPVCNLGNFLRMLAMLKPIKHRSLTSLKEKLVKSRHECRQPRRCVTFRKAAVALHAESGTGRARDPSLLIVLSVIAGCTSQP
jgi:hypothetical protein